MFGKKKPRSHTIFDAAVLIQRRKDIQQHENNSRYRHFRLSVYQFLDHPLTAHSTLYHFTVFFFVLLAVILGASTEQWENHWITDAYSMMENGLLLFFVLEFIVRLWSVEADAKFMGWKGKRKYMRSMVFIADITIITVTFFMCVIEKRYVSKDTMDYLRFIQILRLFHIDRQMTTWRLIKKMIMLSKMELVSAYYITFVLFLVLANAVYFLENINFEAVPPELTGDNTTSISNEPQQSNIPDLAQAWWFSIVTILTIGYGDIVPGHWSSKLVVCCIGFLAYCTFVTASTQISVGLTLLMEEDNKVEYKNKLRNISASVIQCWWRYHRATRLVQNKLMKSDHFRHVCYKLYLTSERLERIREEEKKLQQRASTKKRKSSSAIRNVTEEHVLKRSLRYNITPQVINAAGILDSSVVIPQPPVKQHTHVLKRFMTQFSSVDCDDFPIPMPLPLSENRQRISSDTAGSSSFDSDSEHMDMMHNHYKSSDADIIEVDDRILIRYQPLLRFINYLLFHEYLKKFKRVRNADKMLQMEAELTEREHERDQKLRELEHTLSGIMGKPSKSLLKNHDEKITVSERVNLFEEKMKEMEHKLAQIENLSSGIMKFIEEKALISKSTTSRMHRADRRLLRQPTVDLASPLREDSEDEYDPSDDSPG